MLIVAMFSFAVDAQNLSSKEVSEAYAKAIKSDVTTFLGIPVDGTVSSMKQKLIAKGFKQDSKMLRGKFNGQDVYLSIGANKGKVWRIAVVNIIPYSEAQIRPQYNNLVRQFKNSTKYDNMEEYDPTIDESEDISYEMSVLNKVYEAHFYQESRIEGEDSISSLIESGLVEKSKTVGEEWKGRKIKIVAFYGFKTKDHNNETISREEEVTRYHLMESGKIYLSNDTCNCKHIERKDHRALCEVIFSTYYCSCVPYVEIPYNIAWQVFEKKYNIRNCNLCTSNPQLRA